MKRRGILLLVASCLLLSLVSCSNTSANPSPSVEPATQSPSATPSSVPSPAVQTDDKGIPGMKASTIRLLLDSSFGVPWTDDVPAPDEATNIYTTSCTSVGSKDDSVLYDYSITMDADGEIIGASFGISSIGDTSAQSFLNAADLYFYAIAILPYDTADDETAIAWFEDTLPNATSDGDSLTVGDATFTLYGAADSVYWVDIAKAQ